MSTWKALRVGFVALFLAASPSPAGADNDPDLPWRKGMTVAGEWSVLGVVRHSEFIRLHLESPSEGETVVEIVAAGDATGNLVTDHYLVQPGPGIAIRSGALAPVATSLREFEARPEHKPMVRPRGPLTIYSGVRSPGAATGPSPPQAGLPQGGSAGWVRALQAGWAALFLCVPPIVRRMVRNRRAVFVLVAAAAAAAAVFWSLEPAPLHANGHAWREGRELAALFTPVEREGTNPTMHGHGGVPLLWGLLELAHLVQSGPVPLVVVGRVLMTLAVVAAGLLAWTLSERVWVTATTTLLCLTSPLVLGLAATWSHLTILAAMVPMGLAFAIGAAKSDDPWQLLAAAGTAALTTLSHTAAITFGPALALTWLVSGGGRRLRWWWQVIGLACLVSSSAIQLLTIGPMVSSRSGRIMSSLAEVVSSSLYLDPRWFSPVLVTALVSGCLIAIRSRPPWLTFATAALAISALPSCAVTACSSDARRYQGVFACAVMALTVVALERVVSRLSQGHRRSCLLVLVGLAAAISAPHPVPPEDPTTIEHRFVARTLTQVEPGTVILLPTRSLDDGLVLTEFPDFLVPPGVVVRHVDDSSAGELAGRRVYYLGLACIARPKDLGNAPLPTSLRPECNDSLPSLRPWRTLVLSDDQIPRRADGSRWTFHDLAVGVEFGFFVPVDCSAAAAEPLRKDLGRAPG